MGIARSSVRRIAGTTVAAVLALVLAPAVAAAAPADTGSNITPAERDEILAQHALFRAEVGEPPLVWDNTIAAGAQEWADAKQADGQFAHSSGTGLGENLAGGEVKDATMRLGSDERINYQSDPQPTGQEKKTVGHYTQIVWSSTTKVGCGFAPANKLAFGLVVCRYSPPGNFAGEYPYPVGTTLVPQPGLAPVTGGAGGVVPSVTDGAAAGAAAPATAPASAAESPASAVESPASPGPTASAPSAAATPASEAPTAAPGEAPTVASTPSAAGAATAAGTPSAAGAAAACTDADRSGLSASAAQEALTCLVADARAAQGLPGLATSGPLQTVAAAIAHGTTPPDVPAALTEAGYCPGGSIGAWSYAGAIGDSPKAALDYLVANAHDLVLGSGGDLGVGVVGTTYAAVRAKCS
jgi:uncharacterized protein YkwD